MSDGSFNLDLWYLKNILYSSTMYIKACGTGIKAEFLHPSYRGVYKIIEEHFANPKFRTMPSSEVIIDIVTNNKNSTVTLGQTNEILNGIEKQKITEDQFAYYLEEMKVRYNNQAIIKLAQDISNLDVKDGRYVDITEANKLLTDAKNKVDITTKENINSEGDIGDSAKDRWALYQETEKNPQISQGTMMGYHEIDRITNGLREADLFLIVGSSGAGKSMLMQNMAIRSWLGTNWKGADVPFVKTGEVEDIVQETGNNILFFSIEMPKLQIERRIDSCLGGIDRDSIRDGKLKNDDKVTYFRTLDFQRKYDKKFYIVDVPRKATANMIQMKYDEVCTFFKPDVIIIDYIGLMSPNEGKSGQDWLDLGTVSEEVHEFTRATEKPVVSAAQKKTVDKMRRREGEIQEASMGDVGRSKMLGDNCSIMLMFHDRPFEKKRQDISGTIVKNRDGEAGVDIKLWKDFAKSRVLDFDEFSGAIGDEEGLEDGDVEGL